MYVEKELTVELLEEVMVGAWQHSKLQDIQLCVHMHLPTNRKTYISVMYLFREIYL